MLDLVRFNDNSGVATGRCCFVWVAVCLAITLVGCNVQTRSSSPGPIDADAPEEFSTTDSGLQYRILRKGNGNTPGPTSRVVVDYVGTMDNGIEFDSSYRRSDPTSFRLTDVVRGWTEGLQLVSEGGMIELKIPAELGYGNSPPPGSGIPIGATLNFIVELHEIK
ncbi:FKBP-type peptidyl-prolyl cis-trans isomerase [Crateriforma conspicua]|uniref:Peptidyl-prolyl cis-trans isomerase n=1 Tax=Crateriforma conspicua TaxID=2527996 RepID=A0A5C6FRC2_9PLAN|nr:FKBP-type peptidyl-prolyl cis-trans isomerase [Crateriforma conspicua]TWU63033.1 putative FKBP-type peptidyl-prolyl cis-trans isomerase [Crateriforma conspicua]